MQVARRCERAGWGEGYSQTNSRPCKRSRAADVGCEYTPNRCLPTSSRPVMLYRVPFTSTQLTWAYPPRNLERKDYRDYRRNCMRHNFFSPDTLDARLTLFQPQMEFDLNYTDTAFISLSTTVTFNCPFLVLRGCRSLSQYLFRAVSEPYPM